jgi:surface protein
MDQMFNGCSSLTSLDLSSFDTNKVEGMWGMFQDMKNLKTIYTSDKFVIIDGGASHPYMFDNDINLI